LSIRKQLDENETRKYIRQIVSAVDHMHRANVVHRDLKLQNFMLDENDDIVIIGKSKRLSCGTRWICLIDFGLSNCLDEKGFLTTQCGSPA
jgi:Neu-associated kinase